MDFDDELKWTMKEETHACVATIQNLVLLLLIVFSVNNNQRQTVYRVEKF